MPIPQLPFNPNKFSERIIDGSDSQTLDQLYFIGSSRSYHKKVDTQSSMTANASGNFASNFAGKNFRDILDGGDSESSSAQFYGVILGGVFPTERNGI